jgi:hypothetical protein
MQKTHEKPKPKPRPITPDELDSMMRVAISQFLMVARLRPDLVEEEYAKLRQKRV